MKNEGIAKGNSVSDFTKLIAVSVGHFINDFYMNIIPPILFLFTTAMSLSLTQQALIATVITSSGSFAQPVIGHFIDKHGKPWYLIISVSWIAFWMTMAGVVNNYYLVLLVAGLGAMASALYHPMGTAAAVKLGKHSRGRSLSIFMTIGAFATAIPPLVALPIIRSHGLGVLPYFMIPGILTSIGMYFSGIANIDINTKAVDKKKKSKGIELYTYKWVTVLVIISTYRDFLRRVLMTFGIQLLIFKQVDITIAGLILASYLFLNSGGTIVGGILNDRIGSKKVIIISNIATAICLVGIFMTTGIPLIISFILIGFILTVSNTSNIVMTHDFLPDNINMGTGLILGLGGGLAGLGILVYGKVADIYGLVTAIGVFIIPLVVLSILTFFLPQANLNLKEGE